MNRFILTDPEKCIGCRTCEAACMMSHQSSATPEAITSRIRVVKGGTFTTAVGCHQCEDAPCANVCPTGAIHRAAGAWLVEQARCIGCVQALKCDLCMHREGGPACVEACPTHALRCIDPARLRAERLRNLA